MAADSIRQSGSSSPHRRQHHHQEPDERVHRVEADNDGLKRRLAEVETELEMYRAGGGGGGGGGSAALQEEVTVLRQHNQELNSELAAFDPSFFEEIEDLKYQHGNLADENAQLKTTLARIQQQQQQQQQP